MVFVKCTPISVAGFHWLFFKKWFVDKEYSFIFYIILSFCWTFFGWCYFLPLLGAFYFVDSMTTLHNDFRKNKKRATIFSNNSEKKTEWTRSFGNNLHLHFNIIASLIISFYIIIAYFTCNFRIIQLQLFTTKFSLFILCKKKQNKHFSLLRVLSETIS